jgi:hypothetical protein
MNFLIFPIDSYTTTVILRYLLGVPLLAGSSGDFLRFLIDFNGDPGYDCPPIQGVVPWCGSSEEGAL